MKIAQIPLVKVIDGEPYLNIASKLWKPKEDHNFKGKIYVLINGMSFSSSSVISNYLKANKRAYFVGDETGGAYNSTVAGMFVDLELPNSKVLLHFGVFNLETPIKTTPDGYGVKPDKYIKVTTLEKDEQLDWIINDIKNK
jgi:C-terminal processing protease CtpA/Prc